MRTAVDTECLERTVFRVRICPIQREEDFRGVAHHRCNQVVGGDLEVHIRVAQKPMDAFHRMFRGGVPHHG